MRNSHGTRKHTPVRRLSSPTPPECMSVMHTCAQSAASRGERLPPPSNAQRLHNSAANKQREQAQKRRENSKRGENSGCAHAVLRKAHCQ
eukprot:IDg1641t1